MVLGILGGFIALVVGGELLVRGASNLAAVARISPLVIGLTVVAFGTSAPELAVSIKSCLAGSTELAVGNAVGSNITNLLLILGLSAALSPLSVHVQLFRLDLPTMLAAAVVMWVMARDGVLDWTEGLVLVAGLVGYLGVTVMQGRRDSGVLHSEAMKAEVEITLDPAKATWGAIGLNLAWLALGMGLLVLGAEWLVAACIEVARWWGVSELMIGLTIVAIGTSLPELVTSVMASLRGERDLAVGNVVGSNILNMLAVLGISAVVAPAGIEVGGQSLMFDFPVMIAISAAAVPIFFVGFGITRGEGVAMAVYYVAYIGYLVWHAQNDPQGVSPARDTLLFLAPLVPFTAWVLFSGYRGRHASGGSDSAHL